MQAGRFDVRAVGIFSVAGWEDDINTLLVITVVWGVCFIMKALIERGVDYDRLTDHMGRNSSMYFETNQKCLNCGGDHKNCMRGYGINDRLTPG